LSTPHDYQHEGSNGYDLYGSVVTLLFLDKSTKFQSHSKDGGQDTANKREIDNASYCDPLFCTVEDLQLKPYTRRNDLMGLLYLLVYLLKGNDLPWMNLSLCHPEIPFD
jgi:hypothetical protein